MKFILSRLKIEKKISLIHWDTLNAFGVPISAQEIFSIFVRPIVLLVSEPAPHCCSSLDPQTLPVTGNNSSASFSVHISVLPQSPIPAGGLVDVQVTLESHNLMTPIWFSLQLIHLSSKWQSDLLFSTIISASFILRGFVCCPQNVNVVEASLYKLRSIRRHIRVLQQTLIFS